MQIFTKTQDFGGLSGTATTIPRISRILGKLLVGEGVIDNTAWIPENIYRGIFGIFLVVPGPSPRIALARDLEL